MASFTTIWAILRDCGYAQGTYPPTAFRYLYTKHRRWMVAARGHTIPELVQVAAEVSVEVFKTLTVNPGTSPVRPHLLVSLKHLAFSYWKRFRLAA